MTQVLAVDVGTSVAKVGLWDDGGLRAVGRTRMAVSYPGPARAEQDATAWWPAVVSACRALAEGDGDVSCGDAEAVVLTGARQTFAPVTTKGEALRPAIVWSDRRAEPQARALARRCGGADAARRLTGTVLDAAAPPAKVAWLACHEPDSLRDAAWLVSGRDLVGWHLSGVFATDTTSASASGFYDTDGHAVTELVGDTIGLLPPPLEPDSVLGAVSSEAARATGLPAGVPVVAGAGDRPCEVLGAGAGERRAMVAWGTTANVSMPVRDRPPVAPLELIVTKAAAEGFLLEGGVSAAGSLLDWVAALTGLDTAAVIAAAAEAAPGAGGLDVLPWLGGARAPWWRPDSTGAVLGLGFEHGPAELGRAALEAVAYELARCLDVLTTMGRAPSSLAVGGSAATGPLWLEVLSAVTGLPWQRRRSGEAALAGAAVVASIALGLGWDLERLDPVSEEGDPDPALGEQYVGLRRRADAAAAAYMGVEHQERPG